MPFLMADGDNAKGKRMSGFGSTDKEKYSKKVVKALTFATFCSIIKEVGKYEKILQKNQIIWLKGVGLHV